VPSRGRRKQCGARLNGWRYEPVSEMGFTAPKICAAVFYRPVLIIARWSFAGPKDAG